LTESIGIVLNTIEANMTTEALLKQSQSLAHELQSQQEELQSQQEELQKTNEELEQKARLLADQNTEVERKNLEVEQAKRSLEEKAEQLEMTSRYKSEFLANMSHELRTPLNSLLILAQQLSDNPDGNLSDKQVEFSRIIRSSGQDLLSLINDILDLSKIESGTVALEIEQEALVDIYDFVERTFRHVADAKKLRFSIELAPNLPQVITTDAKRLQQVLKNLLSNAFKFTEKGSVDLRIELPPGGWSADNASLSAASSVISFAVRDTGIGVAGDKQRHIFEAFQQADGSTARKYGGTGLGLSISRELVRLLGGEISLESELGVGTVFTVYLPVTSTRGRVELPRFPEIDERHDNGSIERAVTDGLFRPSLRQVEELPAGMADDRHSIGDADRTVLILEDDPNFARVLLDLAHQNGFKGLIALNGETALLLTRQYRPSAITLDLGLRDISGWAVLDRLKHDPETADIPVHIISVFEDGAERGLTGGAGTYLTKPVGKEALERLFARIDAFISTGGRRLLVVEDDPVQRRHIIETVAVGEVEAIAVGTGKEALEVLRNNRVDCVVLDLGLPDVDGHKLIDQIHRLPGQKELPIIVYTAAELSVNSQARLRKTTKSVIQKSPESSRELATEINSFFDRVRQIRPAATAVAEPVRPPPAPDVRLGGRKALVVDDDVRNIFALAALLERQGMEALNAESGGEAIQLLHENPSIEVVLMDIMMPGMDGYETMSAIRRIDGFENLPVIALTAKAMKGDREKCLEAGASDYIAKPVDSEQLLALLRSWLQK